MKARVAAATLGLALAGAAAWLLLALLGAFLVVEDPLEPAVAIVVLDGGVPLREQEGARLYAQGWAPRVVITRGAGMPDGSASRVDVLLRLGVPANAMAVVDRWPTSTQNELAMVASVVQPGDASVLLVTSPQHTRRTALAWSRVTAGRSRGIVRSAPKDPFEPPMWWFEPQARGRVWHEYVGLAAYVLGLDGY